MKSILGTVRLGHTHIPAYASRVGTEKHYDRQEIALVSGKQLMSARFRIAPVAGELAMYRTLDGSEIPWRNHVDPTLSQCHLGRPVSAVALLLCEATAIRLRSTPAQYSQPIGISSYRVTWSELYPPTGNAWPG